jgi:HAD superfamily hydrolase (TIGR01549 family)
VDRAVIFDCDGVLLDLTAEEEDIFFDALAVHVPRGHLSRDWASYKIRNDDDIISEILDRHGLSQSLKPGIIAEYLMRLERALKTKRLQSVQVPGAIGLLAALAQSHLLGLATANFCTAAQLRLQAAGLWDQVSDYAQGAEGGGHKYQILNRLLKRMQAPRQRIVYIGDNLNDLEAARQNQVHFIGFSTEALRRATLASHGAHRTSADHAATLLHINSILSA